MKTKLSIQGSKTNARVTPFLLDLIFKNKLQNMEFILKEFNNIEFISLVDLKCTGELNIHINLKDGKSGLIKTTIKQFKKNVKEEIL